MEPESATERAALVTWLLVHGAALTTHEVATRTGLSVRGARYLCDRLSTVLPVILVDGYWQVISDEKTTRSGR